MWESTRNRVPRLDSHHCRISSLFSLLLRQASGRVPIAVKWNNRFTDMREHKKPSTYSGLSIPQGSWRHPSSKQSYLLLHPSTVPEFAMASLYTRYNGAQTCSLKHYHLWSSVIALVAVVIFRARAKTNKCARRIAPMMVEKEEGLH